ncbi:hypothetical protein E4U41_006462 [Claviceps citrina]|nr:hypothetical protein E4U41_006462 [Claviceps citrina]
MTSRPDSPSTAAVAPDLLMDPFDIVATQGAYLVPRRAGTPVFRDDYLEELTTKLHKSLELLLWAQDIRRSRYHEDADEWPMGHTPPWLVERREAELAEWEKRCEMLDLEEFGVSDDGSDKDDEKKPGDSHTDPGADAVEASATPRQSKRQTRSHEAVWLPTPLPSDEKTPTAPHGKERRGVEGEADKGEERLAKKHVNPPEAVLAEEASGTVEEAMPKTCLRRGRKRQRVLDAGDEEKVSEERPTKARVTTTTTTTTTTTCPSSIWLRRLRPRRRAG